MGLEFFDEIVLESCLEFGAEGFEVFAFSIHTKSIFIEREGENENLIRCFGFEMRGCEPDIIHAHRCA